MKSKVLLLALATTALSLTSKAQDVTYGIRAGVNFTNVNGETASGADYENKLKAGFNIGVNAEIPVAPEFYLQPGLLFTTKGAKAETGGNKLNLSYLEIPISFLFKPALGPGKLLLGVGPYIGIGVGGKLKTSGTDLDVKFKNDVKASDQSATDPKMFLKRMDFGGNFIVGYELSSKISAQLNAQLGMSNLEPKYEGKKTDAKTKNTGFGISFGYRF